ncbi:MAG: MraY family glycosyltransferase [Bacteroidota bacterium]
MSQMLYQILIVLSAFIVSASVIPGLIRFAIQQGAVDQPGGRKKHEHPTPAFGGVAVLIGLFFAIGLGLGQLQFAEIGIVLAVSAGLFALGLVDDLLTLGASQKLMIQIGLAAFAVSSGLVIPSLDGLLGLYQIDPIFQKGLALLFIVGIMNAMNLIDGIDGLAGGLGMIVALGTGLFLCMTGEYLYGMLGLILAASLAGFLVHNISPANIFMGDNGSLVLGFLLSVLSIRVFQRIDVMTLPGVFDGYGISWVFAMLIVPVFDVVQVSFTRILQGRSPFSPDYNHTHHLLVRLGLRHDQAAMALYLFTTAAVVLTGLGFMLGLAGNLVFVLLLSLALLSIIGLRITVVRFESKTQARKQKTQEAPFPARALLVIRNYLF